MLVGVIWGRNPWCLTMGIH